MDGCGAPPARHVAARPGSGVLRGGHERPPGRRSEPSRRRSGGTPEYVSGTTRDELALLRAVPGAIAKAGAESCYAVALADGRAFALKTDDGAPRVRPVVMAALLRHLGADTEAGVDTDAVRRTGAAPLTGGTEVVGEIRAVL